MELSAGIKKPTHKESAKGKQKQTSKNHLGEVRRASVLYLYIRTELQQGW